MSQVVNTNTDISIEVNDILDILKCSFADKESNDDLCSEEYLMMIERLTDHICGEETNDEILHRLADRLANKFNEIGESEFTNKMSEFIDIIKKEDDEFDETIKNLKKKSQDLTTMCTELHNRDLERNRESLRYREQRNYYLEKYGLGHLLIPDDKKIFDTNDINEINQIIKTKINLFSQIDRTKCGDAGAYKLANEIDVMIREYDKCAKTNSTNNILADHNKNFDDICDLWYLTKNNYAKNCISSDQ